MGILETIAKTTVKNSIESRAKRALIGPLEKAQATIEKTIEKGEEKFEDYQKEMCSKNPNNLHLWMHETNSHKSRITGGYKHKQVYNFYDVNGTLKYHAESRYDNRRQRIILYDINNRKVGQVSEKIMAIRNPISTEAYPANFEIEMNGRTLGKVSSQIRIKDPHLDVKFNGWHVSRRKNEGAYPITDKSGHMITEITPKLLCPTFIDIFRPEDEILILLLILTDEAYTESSDRKKRKE